MNNSGEPARPRVAMVQDGARLHWAVPVALRRAGILDTVYCDWFAHPGSWRAAVARVMRYLRPGLGSSLAGRYHPELADVSIQQSLALLLGRSRRFNREAGAAQYARLATDTGRWIQARGFGQSNVLMGFVRNLDPGLLRAARAAGLVTVGDQMIAPATVEAREARRQHERWPGWEPAAGLDEMELVAEIERRTWENLDAVLCPSEFVRDGLVQAGVNAGRITLLPYPIDAAAFPPVDRSGRAGPITVGFVGAVNLRKGAPCFLEVARACDPRLARFVMVGPVAIDAKALARERGNVEIVGGVARSQVLSWLHRFDVLFFPSTCEGSAGAVMEAMSTGLPVVTSPNAGTPVRDGQEGYVLACDDAPGYALRINELAADRDLRLALGQAALARARGFDLDWYARELAALLPRVLARSNA